MPELVIEFDCKGHVAAMHNDNFDLGFLGDKKITRQTDICFNEGTQNWDIVYLEETYRIHNKALNDFECYEQARAFEVRWLNECRMLGVDPVSLGGINIALELREWGNDY